MENETKKIWLKVYEEASALNTATGAMVVIADGERCTSMFLSGEHWNPDKEEFVAIGSVGERLQTVMETLAELRSSIKEVAGIGNTMAGKHGAAEAMLSALEAL